MRTAIIVGLIASAISLPASAKIVKFKAVGTVDKIVAAGLNSGTVALGTPVSVSFAIDTDNPGCCMDGDVAYAYYYDFRLMDFKVSIGDFTFTDIKAPYSNYLTMGGDPYGAKTLAANVTAKGSLSSATGLASPFPVTASDEVTFTAWELFRNYHSDAIGLSTLLIPGGHLSSGFSYAVSKPGYPFQYSYISGNLEGGFSTSSSVPEPYVWLSLIVGFGIAGGVLRSRRRTVASA